MADINKLSVYLPARFVLAFLVFTGMITLYMLRVNMSVAIVAMAKLSAGTGNKTASSSYCLTQNSSDVYEINDSVENGEFDWDPYVQNYINGGFFWGYFLLTVPGGRLAEMFGTKKVLGGAILSNIILTFFIPLAARTDYRILIAMRFFLGVGQSVVYPSCYPLTARWIPPNERSKFISFALLGNVIGVVVTWPLCGLLISRFGWESAFYSTGILSSIWFLCWIFLMYDTPEQHPRISDEEKEMILESVKEGTVKKVPAMPPICDIAKSPPFWAVFAAEFGNGFGFYVLLTQLPTYMKVILGFDIRSNGALSALPYLMRYIFANIFAQISDYIRSRSLLPLTVNRKIFTTLALVFPGLGLLIASFLGCNSVAAVALFTVALGFNGAGTSGFWGNHLDLAPNYAGTLVGSCMLLGSVPVAFVLPTIISAFTYQNQTNIFQWRKVFYMAAGVYFSTSIIFLIFGSAETQPWNYKYEKKEEKKSEHKTSDERKTEISF